MRKSLKDMARLARFERATAWFVARYSIQLSYRRVEGRYYREEVVCSQGLMGVQFAQNPGNYPTPLQVFQGRNEEAP